MDKIHFYNYKLKNELVLSQSYLRTFNTTIEKGKEKLLKINKLIEELMNNYKIPTLELDDEVEDALNFFDLKNHYTIIDLKIKFKNLIMKNHPDINKNTNATELTSKTIKYYQILKQNYNPNKNTKVNKNNLLKFDNENIYDWFSFVKIIQNEIFFGTYSGRIICIDYNSIKKIIENKNLNEIVITEIKNYEFFYYKSPENEINIIFNIEKNKNKLFIETSSNPFVKKELKNTYQTYKKYDILFNKNII